METFEINGYTLEYIDETHTYLVDGIELPSITQILKTKFGNKYEGIDRNILDNASRLGSKMHEAIEKFEKEGFDDSGLIEVRNYQFLKKMYKWECLENEIPVILFKNDMPIACGRIDAVFKIDDKIGLADFKRTAVLDKEYLGYQLNLYRLAYQQCYGINISFLKGIHLRNDKRKCVDIPINEELPMQLVERFLNQ